MIGRQGVNTGCDWEEVSLCIPGTLIRFTVASKLTGGKGGEKGVAHRIEITQVQGAGVGATRRTGTL